MVRLWPHGRLRLIAALAASCALSLALLAARLVYSGRSTYSFLAWNLALAAIPLLLALGAEPLARRRRAFLPPVVVLWLVFLPNAPYLVTDFVHLRPDPPVPLWFDVLLFAAFAWTGLLLGFVSLHLLRRLAGEWLGGAATWTLTVLVLAASSLAIYLGRFAEWNSWDLFVRPGAVVHAIVAPPSPAQLGGVLAGFTVFLVVAYAIVEALIGSDRER
jgi:uncharacterized membrane protein